MNNAAPMSSRTRQADAFGGAKAGSRNSPVAVAKGSISQIALALSLAGSIVGGGAQAAPVIINQQTSDTSTTSAYTLATRWNPAGVPTSGTPADPNYYRSSLDIWAPNTATSFFGGPGATDIRLYMDSGSRLILRGGTATTIPDLRLNGGTLIVGSGGTTTLALAGVVNLEANTLLNPARGSDSRVINFDALIQDGEDSTGNPTTGNLTIESTADSDGVVQFSNAGNSYTGNTIVGGLSANTAILRMGAASAMPDAPTAGDLIVNANGVFRTNGHATTTQGLAGSGVVENASTTATTLTIQGDSGPNDSLPGDSLHDTFLGTIQNGTIQNGDPGAALSITKIGGDTRQTFTGANTYTGGTTVSGGQLQLKDGGTAGTNAITVTTDTAADPDTYGTLELDTTNVSNAISLVGRGTSDTAHIDSVAGANTVVGGITVQGTGNLNIDNNSSTGGTLTLGDGNDGTSTDNITDADDNAHSLNFGGTQDIVVNADITLNGTGTDAVNKVDANTLTVTGEITASDEINVNEGKLVLSGVASTGAVNVNEGDLNLENTLATTGNVTVGDGTGLARTAILSQVGGSFIDRDQQAGGYTVAADGTVNMNGQAASMNWLSGSGLVTNQDAADPTLTLGNSNGDDATWSGVIADGSAAIDVVKDGTNTQTFAGANTYTGPTDVQAGALRVRNDSALGDISGQTQVTGTGRVEFENDPTNPPAIPGITVAEVFNLFGRTNTAVHMNNVADANTIQGAVNLVEGPDTGPENYTITSTSGTLALDGGVVSALTTGERTLRLGGESTGNTVETLDMAAGATNNVTKFGVGTWSIDGGTVNDAGLIVTQSGTLALTGAAAIDGAATEFRILTGAHLDVSGLDSTFTASTGQSITGGGTVDGAVIAASGASVSPGVGDDDIDTLVFSALELLDDGTLMVDLTGVGAGSTDLIAVTGVLNIGAATVDFDVLSTLNDMVYIFASYGTLTGDMFAKIDDQPAGYYIDYAYQGSQIALVREGPDPVPAPAPLALVGLGLFLLARRARRAKG